MNDKALLFSVEADLVGVFSRGDTKCDMSINSQEHMTVKEYEEFTELIEKAVVLVLKAMTRNIKETFGGDDMEDDNE